MNVAFSRGVIERRIQIASVDLRSEICPSRRAARSRLDWQLSEDVGAAAMEEPSASPGA